MTTIDWFMLFGGNNRCLFILRSIRNPYIKSMGKTKPVDDKFKNEWSCTSTPSYVVKTSSKKKKIRNTGISWWSIVSNKQPPKLNTAPCQLSATVYRIYLQLPSTPEGSPATTHPKPYIPKTNFSNILPSIPWSCALLLERACNK